MELPLRANTGTWRRLSVCRVPTPRDACRACSKERPEESGRSRHECLRHMAHLLLGFCLLPSLGAQDADLMTTVWNGVQRAQQEFTSGCGKIVETRTSLLLARPMVFRGKFCAAGMDRFALEYTEPEPVRILFNKDYLNVTTDGGRRTEVMDVGGNVRRTQAYFSRDNSLGNLKKNFEIAVSREPGLYVMKMTPRTESFRRKISQIVVKLDAAKFLLRSLEVDGKSGVTSVFRIEMTSLNSKIPDGTFDVYRPK